MKHNTLQPFGESIVTTDATVTPIATWTTVPNKAYFLTADVVALNIAISAAQAAGYRVYGTFRTDAAGVLTQVGTTAAAVTQEDNAAWSATLSVSATDASGAAKPEIRVNATGAAATTINWRANVEINRVGIGPENS